MSADLSRRRALQLLASTAAVPAGLGMGPSLVWAADDDRIARLYRRAIVIDSLSAPPAWDEKAFEAIDASGYTGVVTSLSRNDLDTAIGSLMEWKQRVRDHPDRFIIALTAADFERAKKEGKLAALMNMQNATMLEGDVGNVDVLHALGLRCFQLTYNDRNLLGDGSTERTNAGLSDFGVEVVARMNEVGIVVDLSHCGRQTTLDGIAFSEKPPAITHSMYEPLRPGHPRAKTDDQIKALSDKGGVFGVAAIGYFIGKNPGTDTTIEHYLNHVENVIRVGGIEHVGLATDFAVRGLEAWITKEEWYEPRLTFFKPSYDVQWPPWIPELDKPDRFLTVAHKLSDRGYSDDDIEKLLGQNWLRLFRDVFGT